MSKKNFINELDRLKWIIVALVLSFIGVLVFRKSPSFMYFHKFFWWTFGLCVTHLSWKLLFFYFDMREAYNESEIKNDTIFVGLCLFRGIFYFAGMVAFALML